MNLINLLALITMCVGLFSAGYVVGVSRRRRASEPVAASPAARALRKDEGWCRVEIHLLGRIVQTDMLVDRPHLETLANGCGYYLVPLPSEARQ